MHDVVAQMLANARVHPDCDLADDTTVESEIAEYKDDVVGAAGFLLTCRDHHDPRCVFYGAVTSTIMWASGWWGKPDYPSHVEAVFAAIRDPKHRFWDGRPIAAAPADTELDKIRKQMLTRPCDLPHDICDWLINEVGEHYITP